MLPAAIAAMFSRHPCFVFSYAASSPLTLLERTDPLIGRRVFSYMVSAECTYTNMSRNTEKTYQMYSSSRGTPEAFTAFINPSADIDCVR